jgi:membrane protease YdiL (CAAX protease family)
MTETDSSPYQLTVKRGFLALGIMFGSQILIGLAYSLMAGSIGGSGTVDKNTLGLVSVLGGGAITLLWVWSDLRRFGSTFGPQIGLRPSRFGVGPTVLLVSAAFVLVRLLAWIYRAVVLPFFGHVDVVGGASKVFADLMESGSVYALAGFLVLAILVGPVIEELVFRGYFQSALTRRMPVWVAITITSLLFTFGHGPLPLWPMYLMFSVAWGWIFFRTGTVKAAIAFHMLNNIYYAVVAVMGWTAY